MMMKTNLFIYFAQNVDADAAKEFMKHLVDLQSNLPEVNKYVFNSDFRCVILFSS